MLAKTLLLLGTVLAAQTATKIDPVQTIYGPKSHVEKRQYLVLATQAQWDATWGSHMGLPLNKLTGKAAPPSVDFNRHMVVALFQGKTANSSGIEPKEIDAVDGKIRLRFRNDWYQTFGPDGGAQKCCPFGFVVLPKSDKPIVLEEDVHNLIGGAPVWKQRATISPSTRN